jgi:hypothetical protein
MRHWVDELTNREENRHAQNQGAGLGRLAFQRVRQYIELSLDRYHERHPQNRIPATSDQTAELMQIMLGRQSRVGFTFNNGPHFELHRGSLESVKGEVRIDPDDGRMYFMFGTQSTPLESIVHGAIRPILFPDLPITQEESTTEYYF